MFGYISMTYKLYTYIKKLAGYQPVNLFTSSGEFVEVFPNSTFKFLVPAGLFSSSDVALRDLNYPKPTNDMRNLKDVVLPSLYAQQKIVIDKVSEAVAKKKSENRPIYITLHLACGFGKTVTACYIIAKEKVKTVICVPNKMLIPQWKSAIEAMNISFIISINGVKSLLQELRYQDANILVVVSRHFVNDEFCKLVYKKYDMLILDESHLYNLMNNSSMTRYLAMYPPPICYFLTATPRAANRIYCNDIITVEKKSVLKKTIKVIDNFLESYTTTKIRMLSRRLDSPANKYHIYTEKILYEDIHRNELIVNTISDDFETNKINRVMVIVKLRVHMLMLYNELYSKFGEYVILGDSRDKQIPNTVRELRYKNKFIFVSTLNYSGTGLDLPSLDTLVVVSIIMNSMYIEQLLGRVCRETDDIHRKVYVFPSTSILCIRSIIGMFTQRLITLATQSLGFSMESQSQTAKEEKTLNLTFNYKMR
ncbi:DNA helicase [Sea otter poxvirus]|uniref:DNA helicase n=1 Tax=Sea otter poxvirus TaxID=1416741 RepID=A0A2U9QHT5_9POXV|nr:DNA helicase [Sea otter poxvirus]AWU47153.1 DNA helicase [Sea otter poxvirus]